MTVTVTKPKINVREALKRGVSMYGLQIATALQGGALNDVSIGGRTPAAGAFDALSLVSTTDPTLLISNGGGTSPAPAISLFRQAGVSATISYDAASKNLEIQNDYSTVDAFGNIYFKTRGNNTRMAIDGAGNVGIGTVIPSYPLEIWHDTAAALHIHSNRETAGDLAAIYFSTVGSDTSRRKGAIFWQANGLGDGLGDLMFANDGVSDSGSAVVGDVVMTLTSNGRAGIGTTSPTSLFEVEDLVANPEFRIVSNTTGNAYLQFGDSDNAARGALVYRNATDTLALEVADIEATRWAANGALLHGTTNAGSAVAGDIVVNGGIFLGGSAAANELNDFETGAWTPVLSDGTNADATYTIQVGHYTKIGNKVHVQGRIATSAIGTISGSVRITGLPFSSHNVTNGDATVNAGLATGLAITAAGNVSGYIPPNATVMLLTIWDVTTGITLLDATEWTADGEVAFSAEYIAS